jgi:hypothetical protein
VEPLQRTIDHLTDVSKLRRDTAALKPMDLAFIAMCGSIWPFRACHRRRLKSTWRPCRCRFSRKNLRSVVFNAQPAPEYHARARAPAAGAAPGPGKPGASVGVQDRSTLGLEP